MTKYLITIFVDDARLNLSISQEAEDNKAILEDNSMDQPQHPGGPGREAAVQRGGGGWKDGLPGRQMGGLMWEGQGHLCSHHQVLATCPLPWPIRLPTSRSRKGSGPWSAHLIRPGPPGSPAF